MKHFVFFLTKFMLQSDEKGERNNGTLYNILLACVVTITMPIKLHIKARIS